MELQLKYQRPTTKDNGHTNVFIKGLYIGYFMPNRSKFRAVGENYNFVSKVGNAPHLQASNKNKLIEKIKEALI